MEEPDDDFLKFILLMALLVPVNFMFIQENLVGGGLLFQKIISVATVLWKLLLQWEGFVGFQKAIFEYIL